jgi:hypothetical protein
MANYPWYTIVHSKELLNQGDFVFDCPILEQIYNPDSEKIEAEYTDYDVIIMSQSCDLENEKLELVLVCPFEQLTSIAQTQSWFQFVKNLEKLRQGIQPNYHLLNQCDLKNFLLDFIVVDFRTVYSIPYHFLKQKMANTPSRLRLLSPYKEHLSQAFARFFMRVGLPVDIPTFK